MDMLEMRGTGPEFVLRGTRAGLPALACRGRTVPVSGARILAFVRDAGIRLGDGAAIRLEASAAKALIEDSLRDLARDEAALGRQRKDALAQGRDVSAYEAQGARLRRRKVELIAASLHAGDLLDRALAGFDGSEAA